MCVEGCGGREKDFGRLGRGGGEKGLGGVGGIGLWEGYRAEKRRDHGNRRFPWPRLFSALYLRGGSPEKFFFSAQITAIAFSYIRTEFGASRSMRVGVRSAKQ